MTMMTRIKASIQEAEPWFLWTAQIEEKETIIVFKGKDFIFIYFFLYPSLKLSFESSHHLRLF